MIFSVLLNEWGGGQQLEGVDTKDLLSSLEKGKDQMEPGFGNGQVEDTKEEMIRHPRGIHDVGNAKEILAMLMLHTYSR